LNNQKTYLLQLDGFRWFAVLMVLIGHWLKFPFFPALNEILASCGVILFFVLSGFLISQILLKNKDFDNKNVKTHWYSLRQFYIRRFLRIFPIYYLTIFASLLINLEPLIKDKTFWFFSYTSNILWSFNLGDAGKFTHFWSLAVEEQFYLFFPFLIFFIKKKDLKNVFFITILVAIIFRIITFYIYLDVKSMGPISYAFTPSCIDSFGIGALLAWFKLYDIEKLKKYLLKYYFIIILFLIFAIININSKGIFYVSLNRFIFSLICFYIIGFASLNMYKGYLKIIIENKLIIYLGKISYGIYIFHNLVPNLLNLIFTKLNIIPFTKHGYYLIIWFFIYLTTTLIISIISWNIIEYPINKLKKYFEYY
jgi:peptidoglycan/LPS O-acetylase OafA/YrhL